MSKKGLKYCPRVKDRRTALRAYRKLINLFWRDLIDNDKARILARLLDGYLKGEASYKLDELELQIKEIEEQIKRVE
jgi:hypothetical protein